MGEVIHIVDDDRGVRDSLAALLELKGYAAVAHGSCADFLKSLKPEEALCVLADLRMPAMGGLELQEHLGAQGVNVPFIVITGYGDVPSAVTAMKAGAADFIEKPIDTKLLLAAVEKAAAQSRLIWSGAAAAATARSRIAGLTPREHDVLRQLMAGHPNKIIAHALRISPRTVENHRARLMVKMRVDSVAELVRLAVAAGVAPAGAA